MTPTTQEPAVVKLFDASRLLSEAAHKIANVSGLTDAEFAELDDIDRMVVRAGTRLSVLMHKIG